MNLDRRIQFRRATLADDGFGFVETWANHGSPVWAKKTDISEGERWRAQEMQAQITTRFVVRYSEFTSGITPKDRIAFEGREYDLSGIKEIGARRTFLEITAAARSDLA
jgi:SPP1 family predicted phage head-tail adaptor